MKDEAFEKWWVENQFTGDAGFMKAAFAAGRVAEREECAKIADMGGYPVKRRCQGLN